MMMTTTATRANPDNAAITYLLYPGVEIKSMTTVIPIMIMAELRFLVMPYTISE